MLKRFEVGGYRNFNEAFILDFSDVREYQFNKQCIRNGLLNNLIIYGKNAVGKTNFGRAIFDIQNNFRREFIVSERENDSFLNADSNTGYASFSYTFSFNENEVIYEYKKKSAFSFLSEKFSINQKVIFEYNHDTKEKIMDNLELINAETLNWEFADDDISVISYIINNVQLGTSEVLGKFYRFIKEMQLIRGNNNLLRRPYDRIVSDIIENNWLDDFQNFLNRFGIEEKLIVIDLGTGDKMLCFKHIRPIPFIENCSSGTFSLLRLYSWKKRMDNSTASFLYMDEFDAFYHYELSEEVIKLFGELDYCQTVVTSHNTNLLSNKIMRPDCFFILLKNKLISIVKATERELREGHNLEKLYKSGEFGE